MRGGGRGTRPKRRAAAPTRCLPGGCAPGGAVLPQDWGAGGARHEGGSAIQLDASLPAVALGAVVVCCAALLGGATGFGYALLSAPLLLLLGFRLEFVVTANLALAVLTRVSVVYRF